MSVGGPEGASKEYCIVFQKLQKLTANIYIRKGTLYIIISSTVLLQKDIFDKVSI
jgi:hypothetical protein